MTLLLPATPSWAVDLGTIGPTYAIAEPHLLHDLRHRLEAKQASGELDALIAERRQRGVAAVRHPPPVTGVVATRAPRTFHYDPTFTLDRNVLDAQGRLLFAAGTRKNPLDVVSLSTHLLIFDGRDPRQRDQARRLMAHYDGQVRPVLVAGSYLDLMQAWRRPVYFDQHGRLTRQLGITQVPALVSQDGARLRIDELEIPR
ncbi:type-F conjugative transfer system protein TraW [Xanthomonas hortorum]|uniref:Type-F conjugative transfer system protein TraW n=1 Tax=Xanthomonas hortorum pv. hederae TaxID=453603 RepID=A0A9X3YZJ7_9XANT|nr:type-F conjugative transfer system protein TraW [Xanthomonas hortorum]MCE4369663.1 type-F conjugative transfer system protein TraW [Xanthomonas hortorum pv. hederae]MDC8637161.1 type-F conjugative transfer system protein TraW [Xanthomonas hortorum pv. hederae]